MISFTVTRELVTKQLSRWLYNGFSKSVLWELQRDYIVKSPNCLSQNSSHADISVEWNNENDEKNEKYHILFPCSDCDHLWVVTSGRHHTAWLCGRIALIFYTLAVYGIPLWVLTCSEIRILCLLLSFANVLGRSWVIHFLLSKACLWIMLILPQSRNYVSFQTNENLKYSYSEFKTKKIKSIIDYK